MTDATRCSSPSGRHHIHPAENANTPARCCWCTWVGAPLPPPRTAVQRERQRQRDRGRVRHSRARRARTAPQPFTGLAAYFG